MSRNRLIAATATLGLLAAALLLAGCGADGAAETPREVATNVRVMPLETAAVTEFHELAGPVMPVRGADVSSEESGTVARVDAPKGAAVDSGAAVITLDRRLIAAELAAAEAALELADYNLEKTRQLFTAGKISRLELLQVEADAAAARSQRDVARTRHERASIAAPFAGLVANRYVEPGELVGPGTLVARIIDPYVLKLEGALTEREVAWVREGMPATVHLEGEATPAEGRVAWVGFEADPRTGKFPLEVHLDNSDLRYRSGVIGRARLARRTTDDLVVIPRDAVLPGDRGEHVFVVEDDRAARRRVVLGPDQGLMVAVRRGLQPGELLVVRGQRELADGSLVTITERVAYGDGTAPDEPAVIKAESAGTRVGEEAVR
jgi:RND family efflux transporter MFP subunit